MEDFIEEINVAKEIALLLVSQSDDSILREELDKYYDYEIGQALMVLGPVEKKRLFELLSISRLTEVFEELAPEVAYLILRDANLEFVTKIFKTMETDDLVDIIGVIEDEEDRAIYLSLVEVEKRISIKSLLKFDQSLVGSIMNNSFISIKRDFTVKSAINEVVRKAPEVEFIHNIYVIDDMNVLQGALSLKELISAGYDKTQFIEDIMSVNLIFVTPTSKIEDAIEIMKNYDFLLLPVIDKDRKLIGIISFDDVIEALNVESETDYSRLAALTDVSIDEKETVFMSIKKRLPWLVVLLFINLITSTIISGFEAELMILPTLAVFMPLILNMAGNSGTQSLGIIIRLFATNQLKQRSSIFKHVLNEFFTGLTNGVMIGIGLFIMVILFNLIKGQDFMVGFNLAFVVAISICIALIVSTLSGTLVPLFINFIKIDPAVASGPFITTINDILSLLIYFSLASLMIANLM